MGYQKFFEEVATAFFRSGRRDYLRRDTSKIAPLFAVLRAEDQWDQAWLALHDAQTEMLGESLAKACRTHLRDREAAGSNDDGVRLKDRICRSHKKISVLRH